jgi:hypothetical protein
MFHRLATRFNRGAATKQVRGIQMSTFEKHFSPKELSEAWGLSDTKIRRIFKDERGVVLVGEPSRRLGKKLKRSYYTMLIPESLAIKVYERLRKK